MKHGELGGGGYKYNCSPIETQVCICMRDRDLLQTPQHDQRWYRPLVEMCKTIGMVAAIGPRYVCIAPRNAALLIIRLRPNNLKVVS